MSRCVFSCAGGGGQCVRPDSEALHQSEPPGPGGPRCSAEHLPDQPDALRPQQGGLRQRTGKLRLQEAQRPAAAPLWPTLGLSYRSRRRGSASVTRAWSSVWSRTSRWPCSSRAPWTSGPPGWTMWSLRSWSLTRGAPASPKPPASSCSSGPSTGTERRWGRSLKIQNNDE